MIRAAIVGCGAISQTHADAITKNGGVLIAVCDIIEDRALSLGEKYGSRVYTALDSMLNSEQIDVLHICLPHHLHVKTAIHALLRDINVMLEKPPAMTLDEYNILYDAVKNSNADLCVNFQNRFNESTIKAAELINSGEYGRLLGARGIVTWCREGEYYTESEWRGKKKYEGGGVLINQSIHTLDLINYFLGKPKNVMSASNNFTHPYIDVEDNVSAVIDYGTTRAVFFATTSYVASPEAEVMLSFEKANVTIGSKTMSVKPKDGERIFFDFRADNNLGKACWGTSHARIIGAFYRSLCGDGQNPCTLDMCYDTVDVMSKIYKE